ncbi:hypothetical protein ARMSODRAFT_1027480 [Armillaria solidipes]|uniref:Uncharacterized protein n=1 Tax=Armillaria solidipes TaxID=1076256 RepID=A0A2H3B691_9AGAR|nr:hypothetical protein ARMSODRAFT_1027480 [Armillaria solidipes]
MEEVIQERFNEQLQALQKMQRNNSVLGILSHMRDRVSTNPVDRIAGLAYLLDSTDLPTYDMEQSEESAWVAFMNAMGPWSQVELLFFPIPTTIDLHDVAYSPESVCFDGWPADCLGDTEFETLAAGDYILAGSSYLEVFMALA